MFHHGARPAVHEKEELSGIVEVGIVGATEIAFRADDTRVLQTRDPAHNVDVMNE